MLLFSANNHYRKHISEFNNTSTERNEFDSTKGNDTKNELSRYDDVGYLSNENSLSETIIVDTAEGNGEHYNIFNFT